MASSPNTNQAAPPDGETRPRRMGLHLRVIAVVTAFSIGLPPLPLLAATWDDAEAKANPFTWPPPSVPLPAQIPGKYPPQKAFPDFVATPAVSPLLPPTPAEEPWLPGDLDPIAPPDGMPVQGGPVGLALLENAVGNGIIVGEVSDATSLDPVPGALVEIVGTGRTAEADAQGRFQFGGLPAGTFNIEASQLGYFTDTTVVTVIEGSPSEVRFGLRSRPTDDSTNEFTLEEETIIGEYQGDSAGDLFMDLQLSTNIAAVIGKEEFSQAGISDAAGAVSKIAGANIVGGKYAVVRGLGDRYSNTLFNRASISSADPSKKAVQLDLFPSGLLQSVAIYKNFTPDLPAEFAGGTVAIETLRFPEKPLVDFSMGTGWNSNLNDADMRVMPGREFDFFGNTDDGIPASVGTGTELLTNGYSGTRPLQNASAAQKAAAANAALVFSEFHASAGMRSATRAAEPNNSFSLLLGNTYEIYDNIQLGGVFGFTWDKEDQIREDVKIGRLFNPGQDGITGTADDRLDREGVEDTYTASLDWGLLGSLSLKAGDNHEIGYSYFRNSSSEDQISVAQRLRRSDGDNLIYLPSSRTPGNAGAFAYVGYQNLVPLQRDLEVQQFTGKHTLGEKGGWNPIIEWAVTDSDSVEERPHSTTLFNYILDYTDPRIQTQQNDIYRPELGILRTASDVPAATQGTGTLLSYRETLKTEETASNERVDLTLPVFSSEDETSSFSLKLGMNDYSRARQVRGRFFTYEIPSPLNAILFDDANDGRNGVIYLENYDSPLGLDGLSKFNGWTGTGARNGSDRLFISEATRSGRTVRNVDAESSVEAQYLMTSITHAGWDLVAGARLEKEQRSYDVIQGLNNNAFVQKDTQTSENVLPGITLSRGFGQDDKFRTTFAWSETIARPTFYEFAPVQTEDQATGDIIVGNPNLTNTLITNFDLRLDWKPTPADSISFNLFHKVMDAPIAQAYDLTRKTWVNGTDGFVQGLEIDARRSLTENWSLYGNYTFINSLLRYNQRIGTSGTQVIDSSYEGQPEHIFNLILGYDNKDTGYSASLVYNFTGAYLTGVPLSNTDPTIIREGYHSLDLIFGKSFRLWECDGNVRLKLGNILDRSDRDVFEGTDFTYRSFSPGRSVSLSFGLSF